MWRKRGAMLLSPAKQVKSTIVGLSFGHTMYINVLGYYDIPSSLDYLGKNCFNPKMRSVGDHLSEQVAHEKKSLNPMVVA